MRRVVAMLVVGACGYPQPSRVQSDGATIDGVLIDAMLDARPIDAPFDMPGLIDGSLVPDYVARCAMDDDPSDGTPLCEGATAACTGTACPVAGAGHVAGGYVFSGSDIIKLTPTSLIGTKFSVAVWVKPAASTGFVDVFGAAISTSVSQDTVAILIGSGNDVLFESTNNSTSASEYLQPGTVNMRNGSFHHIVVSWDGTTKRLYVDGALAGSVAGTAKIGSGPIAIGADYDSNAPVNFCPGVVDELRIYTRALTSTEVTSLASQ